MPNYFASYETACRCGCGLNSVHPGTMDKLNIARESAGIPFILNSASRCATYNKRVGGKDDSAHIPDGLGYSYAVDIHADSSRERLIIVRSLLLSGFSRIGIGHRFIHVDDSPHKAGAVMWLYDENNNPI